MGLRVFAVFLKSGTDANGRETSVPSIMSSKQSCLCGWPWSRTTQFAKIYPPLSDYGEYANQMPCPCALRRWHGGYRINLFYLKLMTNSYNRFMNYMSLNSVVYQSCRCHLFQFRLRGHANREHPLLQVGTLEVGELAARRLEVLDPLVAHQFIEVCLLDTEEEACLVHVVDVLGLEQGGVPYLPQQCQKFVVAHGLHRLSMHRTASIDSASTMGVSNISIVNFPSFSCTPRRIRPLWTRTRKPRTRHA